MMSTKNVNNVSKTILQQKIAFTYKRLIQDSKYKTTLISKYHQPENNTNLKTTTSKLELPRKTALTTDKTTSRTTFFVFCFFPLSPN